MKYSIIILFFFSINIYGQALDPTFASNGIFQLASIKKAHDIVVDSAQNIYVAGETQDTGFVLLKLTPDGQIDTTFGVDGFVYVSAYRWAKKIIIQDEKILVLGDSSQGVGVLRFTHDGLLDTSFGDNGVFHYTSINSEYYTRSLFLFQDGILVCGEGYFQGQSSVVLIKLTENGEVDMSYGNNNGIATSFFNVGGSVRAFDIDEFDNLYVLGKEMGPDWKVVKYDNNGIPVFYRFITFGNHIEPGTNPSDIKVSDNMLFVSGEIREIITMPATTFTYTHIVKMESSNGSYDTSFGGDGRVSYTGDAIEPGLIYYFAGRSFLLDDVGRVILGGVSKGPYATIMRKLNQDGSIGLEEVLFQYLAIYNSFTFQFGNKIIASGAHFTNNHLIVTRHFDGVLSVDENQKNNSISIYPNPAYDFFRINSERYIDSVKVYNLLGVLQLEYKNRETYSILGLPSGIYLVTIEYQGGTETKKLVVH
jgi:uncharacterized delta-60 repeat protein